MKMFVHKAELVNEYPIVPKIIKEILQEGKFPVHKINNDLF